MSQEEEILSLLKKEGKPLTSEQICRALNIPKHVASSSLFSLLRKGMVKRVYTEDYDPTRPFDTVSWVIE